MICRSMKINRDWAAPQPVIWIYCSVGASLAVFHNIYRPIYRPTFHINGWWKALIAWLFSELDLEVVRCVEGKP